MIPILLRALAVVGVGAVVAGCEEISKLFDGANENSESHSIERVPVEDCQHVKNSIDSFEILNPKRELTTFQSLGLIRRTQSYVSQTNRGEYRSVRDELSNHGLNNLQGLRFYIGESLDSQSDIDNLVSAFTYLAKLGGLDVTTNLQTNDSLETTPQIPDQRPNDLRTAWNSNAIRVIFRRFELYRQRDAENYYRTIITPSNIDTHPRLDACYGLNRNDPNYFTNIAALNILSDWK